MLVLARKVDEKIIIGDVIEISVVSIRGDKVRLGITAPSHVTVHREEVAKAISDELLKRKEVNDAEENL